MINKQCLGKIVADYKANYFITHWADESFKWKAVKYFQDVWDIESKDFSGMLDESLNMTYSLLASQNNFPRGMIVHLANQDPEAVRAMFVSLYDESKDLWERIEKFKNDAAVLTQKYGKESDQHFQGENAITTYLWLKFPDKYYIYKYGEAKKVAEALESDHRIKKGDYANNIRNHKLLYDEIAHELRNDQELIKLLRDNISDNCYPDTELVTLTIDLGFYISRYGSTDSQIIQNQTHKTEYSADRNYWWLNANPSIWRFSDLAVGERQNYTFFNENGNKRRIYQNFVDARVGDVIIGYESSPVKQIVALAKINAIEEEKSLSIEKIETLTSPLDYQALYECPELQKMEYFVNPQGSLFKLTSDEYEFIMDLIREENPIQKESTETYTKDDFLEEVFMTEEKYNNLAGILKNKKNVILQGAPGVGKTFAAKRMAYSLMGIVDEDRVEVVQFHQNYSYEDFIMGYKPVGDGFELKNGVFYRFCQKAENNPDKEYFFIIDEINRGNMSKIFGELLMLIEKDYRGTKATMAYNGMLFSVPRNLYIIGMMNTADRSLAMIDYALRRRFSFFEMEPGFDSEGFQRYQKALNSETLDELVLRVKELNREITLDKSLGKGFCIGHSYFCGRDTCTDEWLKSVVEYDIIPMISEYWFDDSAKLQRWENVLRGVFQ